MLIKIYAIFDFQLGVYKEINTNKQELIENFADFWREVAHDDYITDWKDNFSNEETFSEYMNRVWYSMNDEEYLNFVGFEVEELMVEEDFYEEIESELSYYRDDVYSIGVSEIKRYGEDIKL